MSLYRFVYYSAVIAGWAAFLVWSLAEVSFLGQGRGAGTVEAALIGALIGFGIAMALNLVSNVSVGRWRLTFSGWMAGGAMIAAVGGILGALLYSILVPHAVAIARPVGWMILGLGIGAADGISQRSVLRVRNGLIGGGLGGLFGGLLFDPIATSGSDTASRAFAFVLLGVSIGALIGLAHVVLKEAWLTVVDGYGTGRQLVLTRPETPLGRGDHLPLPFLGYAGRDLESEHVRIRRQADGQYTVEDSGTRTGTLLNGQRLERPMPLHDGDLIKLGSNIVRFEHRKRLARTGAGTQVEPTSAPAGTIGVPPPPPLPPPALPNSPSGTSFTQSSQASPSSVPSLPSSSAGQTLPQARPQGADASGTPKEVASLPPPLPGNPPPKGGSSLPSADSSVRPPANGPRIPPPPPPPTE